MRNSGTLATGTEPPPEELREEFLRYFTKDDMAEQKGEIPISKATMVRVVYPTRGRAQAAGRTLGCVLVPT